MTLFVFRIEMHFKQFVMFSAILSAVAAKNDCHACLAGACFSRTPIFEGKLSGQIAIDRIGNIVYFHYKNSQFIDYTAAFDLDNIRYKVIPNIDFSFARAVDQSNRDVYIGGVQGIFKYNPVSNKTSSFGIFDKTIWHLQYKNKIYYTIFKTKGLYVYENKHSKGIPALSNYNIDDFVIDMKNDIYFMSDSKIYRLKKDANQASVVANDMYVLAIDNFNDMYFVQPISRGIYKYDYKTDTSEEIGVFAVGAPFKVVFDVNNNIIYYDKYTQNLYYLTPNFGRCKVSRVGGKKFKKITDVSSTKTKLSIQLIN